MRVIERWLTMNAWETLVLAKAVAAFIILKALHLNNYLVTGGVDLLKKSELAPERKALALIFYLGVFLAQWHFSLDRLC